MDTPLTRTNTQYQWRELSSKIQELSEATAIENAELANKVKELEVDLSVWKRAAREAVEREDKMRGELLVSRRQLVNGTGDDDEEPRLALCIIDGTRSMFATPYLQQGDLGGRRAGEEFIRGIRQNMAEDANDTAKEPVLWIQIYVNKHKLVDDLIVNDCCTTDQFDQFFAGLSQTSPSLSIIDVVSKHDADTKIRAYLQTFASLPQTSRVFFAGGYGSEYSSIHLNLQALSVSTKLVFVRSQSNASSTGSMPPLVPTLQLNGLFMKSFPSGASSYISTTAPPASALPMSPNTAGSPFPDRDSDGPKASSPGNTYFFNQNMGSFSPKRPTTAPMIDPTLPLYKRASAFFDRVYIVIYIYTDQTLIENPPPCNEHYLLEQCSKEGRCKYSHDYILTSEQLQTLARNAKQSPCWFLNNGAFPIETAPTATAAAGGMYAPSA
ncbi:hypothetical protein OF83DRAFT_1169181 [Amylostereum chailletii]|nr:hypothetical protein OF83DRAFT_1169181 [Amylostereum chailletii]